MSARQTKFYLDRQNRKWKGVCAGIADYTGIDVTLVRVAIVALAFMTSFFPVFAAYWLIGWFAPDKPYELAYTDRDQQKFWQGVRAKPSVSIRDVRSRFRDIDRRLADVEYHVTSQNSRLSDEIEALR